MLRLKHQCAAALVAAWLTATVALAQPAPKPDATAPAAASGSPVAPLPGPGPAAGRVSFQHLPDNVEVKALLDYLSQRLGINIIYDDRDVANATITVKAPADVPADQVLPLIESMLRAKGLALIDASVPGWKRVVPIARLGEAGGPITTGPTPGSENARITTRLFTLRFGDPAHMKTLLGQFVATGGRESSNVEVLANQKALLITDTPANLDRIQQIIDTLDRPNPTQVRFIPVKNSEARTLTKQLTELMTAKAQSEGLTSTRDFKAIADERANQVLLIGSTSEVDTAGQLLAALDTPVQRDVTPVQSYPLANTTAESVLQTIQQLEGEDGLLSITADGRTPEAGEPLVPATGEVRPAMTPAPADSTAIIPRPVPAGRMDTSLAGAARAGQAGPTAIRRGPARVTADIHTNSIIVVGPPQVQKVYEALIKMLDRRRPQVLVEVTLVTLDTTDGFELGVDIGGRGGPGDNPDVITFSQFGVGVPNSATGGIRLPTELAPGFSGAILGPGNVDIVINALKSTTRANISSAPRLLVNDNAEARLSSIAEEPFETSVVSSNSVSQRSFGGFEKAGTIITVEPHISEDDYLQLKYEVELSSFVGQRPSEGLPPARRTDVTKSVATIPDGSTIIVGGISAETLRDNVSRVPFLGEIPILEYAFSSRSETKIKRTFFVFIRPIILRDREFQDLRYYSGRDAQKADVNSDYPASKPQLMR